MATATVEVRSNQRHAHKPNGADAATERCPWCGSFINRAEFERIRDEIAAEERARIAKVEQTLKDRFAVEIEKAKRQAGGLPSWLSRS